MTIVPVFGENRKKLNEASQTLGDFDQIEPRIGDFCSREIHMKRINSKNFCTTLFLALATCRVHQEPGNESDQLTSSQSDSTGPNFDSSTNDTNASDSNTDDIPPFVVPPNCRELFQAHPKLFEPCRSAGWSAGGMIQSQADLDRFKGKKCIADGIAIWEAKENINLNPLANVQVICDGLSLGNFEEGIELFNFSALNGLKAVGNYIQLHGLAVDNLNAFANLEVTTNLGLYDLKKLLSLDGLARLGQVDEIRISNCTQLANLKGFSQIKTLARLELWDLEQLTSLDGLGSLQRIKYLDMESCPRLKNLGNLKQLRSIFDLRLSNMKSLSNFEGLESLESIYTLHIQDAPEFTDFDALSQLDAFLQSIHLQGLPNLVSLVNLRMSNTMSSLSLVDTPKIMSLSPFGTVTNLDRLTLAFSPPIEVAFDLQGLSNLRHVNTSLTIYGISNWQSLRGLEQLEHAAVLSLISLHSLNDLSALERLRKAKFVKFGDLPQLEPKKAEAFASAFDPVKIKIAGCQDQTPLPLGDCPWPQDGSCDESWGVWNFHEIEGLNVCIDDGFDCASMAD